MRPRPVQYAAALLAMALVLSTCGDEGDDATPSTPATTTPQPVDGEEPSPASVAARLTEAGLGCEDIHPPDPAATAATVVPEPEGEIGECTINGLPAEITVLADEDAVEMANAQLDTVVKEYLKAFGIEEIQFVRAGPDDRVLVSVSNLDSSTLAMTDQQKEITMDVADALDGEVVTIEP